MLKLISNPDEFFAELKQREPNLIYPILIVIVLAILASVGQYLVVSKISQAFPPKIAKYLMVGAYIGIVTSFFASFIVWLVVAVIFYAISSVFGGKGEFKRTLEFSAYGFVPNIIGSCITLPFTYHYISQAEIPPLIPESLGIEALRNPEVMKSIMQAMFPTEAIYASAIVSLAILLWSLTIWTFALKHARELSLRNAFISVLIPTALHFIYQLWSILKYVL